MTAVLVGRFSPLHKGHQLIIDYMVKKYGIENCLILVGSSNSLTERTPYTFEQRKKMIHLLYPQIKVLPLPDIEPELELYSDNTNDLWLENIKRIEKSMDTKFIFYRGSFSDLEVLSKKFSTKVAVDRKIEGHNISGTYIRKNISNKNYKLVEKLVDIKIRKLIY